jgi:ketosteroid isomerase-like protein
MSTATITDNASVVLKMYQAFKNGDIPRVMEHISDTCKWVAPGKGLLPHGGTFIGNDIARFFQLVGENINFNSFDVHGAYNINSSEVIAFGHMHGTSKNTGKTSESDWAMHWKFDATGKAVYFHEYYDTAGAYLANQ